MHFSSRKLGTLANSSLSTFIYLAPPLLCQKYLVFSVRVQEGASCGIPSIFLAKLIVQEDIHEQPDVTRAF